MPFSLFPKKQNLRQGLKAQEAYLGEDQWEYSEGVGKLEYEKMNVFSFGAIGSYPTGTLLRDFVEHDSELSHWRARKIGVFTTQL